MSLIDDTTKLDESGINTPVRFKLASINVFPIPDAFMVSASIKLQFSAPSMVVNIVPLLPTITALFLLFMNTSFSVNPDLSVSVHVSPPLSVYEMIFAPTAMPKLASNMRIWLYAAPTIIVLLDASNNNPFPVVS